MVFMERKAKHSLLLVKPAGANVVCCPHSLKLRICEPFLCAFRLTVAFSLIAVSLMLQAETVLAYSIGDRVQCTTSGLRIRSAPNTNSNNTIDYAYTGDLGVIAGGPYYTNGYTWYSNKWDIHLPGYSVSAYLQVVVPAAPNLYGPGTTYSPGPPVSTAPTLVWYPATGATGYELYVYDQTAGGLAYINNGIGNVTSLKLPSNILTSGHIYSWYMRSSDSAGYSPVSTSYYFQYFAPATFSPSGATSVTASSAVLNGTVYPNGTAVSVYFQYGKTTSYGTGPVGSQNITTSLNSQWLVWTTINGLSPNTTYHYQLVANNGGGTYYGPDSQFTTSGTTYSITTSSSPTAGGTTSGGGNYTSGQSVTVTATANTGYTFVNWTESGSQVSTSASYTFTATASRNLVANFSPVGAAPVASFSGDLEPVTGKLSTYNGSLSTGTAPLSYSWTTTAGHTSTAIAPSFAFNSPGTYTISLTVTDSIGRQDTASSIIYVQPINNGATPGQPVGADPVVLSAGNYILQHVDLRMPGKGFSFEFKRFYNSKFGDQTGLPLGFGWTYTYNEHLENTGTNVLVVQGDGSTWAFFQSGGGYISEPGFFDTLVHNGDGTWSLTDKSQTVRRFDSTGHLTSITDKNGNVLNLFYTGGILDQIEDTSGRTILFNTNAYGCISSISDPIGRTISFQYDSQTNLVAVVDANGNTNRYVYNNNHQMTDAYDPLGNCYVHNEYDTNSFVVVSQRDALNNWTYLAYDFTNRITHETNPLDKVSVHTFDERLLETNVVDEAGNQQSFAFDTNRDRVLVKDKNGNVTGYAYDSDGNVTAKTNAFLRTTIIAYDALNNPTNRVDALGSTTIFRYDAKGNLTSSVNSVGKTNTYQYDAYGEPTIVTDANGNSTTNTYDSFGNLIKTVDALGDTNLFVYDAVGRKTERIDGLGHTHFFIYDNDDNLIATVNGLGKTNYFVYDGDNNRVSSTDFNGNTTTNIYDAKNRLIAVGDPLGDWTTNVYDALGRKTEVIDPMGNVTQYGYDADGNLLAMTNTLGDVTRYAYDPNGNRTNIIDALGNSTTNIFDPLNRLVSTEDPLGHVTASVYDALSRRIRGIDALDRTNFFAYDLMGRLTNFTDAAGGTVSYTYDNVGNRLTTTDPNGHTTTNVYDPMNRLVKIIDPNGGVTQLGYDAAGNLISRKDPDGNVATYRYDANNQRTNIIYPTGTPVTFTYDANGNRIRMTDGLGVTTYAYDGLNRLTNVTDCYGMTVSYGYDRNGNRTSVTYPGNKTVHYTYDAMNRLKTVTDWLGDTTTYNYDKDGNLIGSVNPNGTATAYQYDQANRLIALTNWDNGTVISSYQYTLDAVGNQNQVSQTEQLPTVPIVGQASYAYDSDNQMTNFNGQAQVFDANGNMLSLNGTNTLSYDYENRLIETVFDGVTNSYLYDGVGNRLAAIRNGVTTRYVLDRQSPLAQVLAETDANGNVIAYYIYGLGLICKIDAYNNAEYYQYDSRGSTVALTDANGQLVEAYAYDPFGRPINGQISDNRFRYLGRWGVMDEENGFLYIRARYYSTKRGRFITKDPTTGTDGDSQSLNRYIYALNNPVRLIDISGLSAQETSGQTLQFATSDSSLSHNMLISLDTLGYQARNNNLADKIAAEGELVLKAAKAYAEAVGLNPGGIVTKIGVAGLVVNIANDTVEQVRSGNVNFQDINSIASASQAVAINVLMDFSGASYLSTTVYGNSGHITGSQAIQAEHTIAIAIASEELALPGQIMNGYVNSINAAGNWLSQTTGF